MAAPKKERIPDYLEDVLKAADKATFYLEQADFDLALLDDEDAEGLEVSLTRDGIVRQLEIIGQALDNIDTADEQFVTDHSLPVKDWYGLRSKISHGYDVVIYEILVNTILDDVPKLVAQIQSVLAKMK